MDTTQAAAQTTEAISTADLDGKDLIKSATSGHKFFEGLTGTLGGLASGALSGVAGVLGIQKGANQAANATNDKDRIEGELTVGKGGNDVLKGGVSVGKTLSAADQAAEAARAAGAAENALAGGASVKGAAAVAGADAATTAKILETAQKGAVVGTSASAEGAAAAAAAQGSAIGSEVGAASTAGKVTKFLSTAGKVLGVAGGALDAGIGVNKIVADGATNDQKIDGASDIAGGALTAAATLATGPAGAITAALTAANKLATPALDKVSKEKGYFGQDANGNNITASQDAAASGASAQKTVANLVDGVPVLGNDTVKSVLSTAAGGATKLGVGIGNNLATLGRWGLDGVRSLF